MTVGESRILTGKQRESVAQLNRLLSACWLETTDAGPYALEGGTICWNDVLQGDRFYVLMQVRVLTFGEEYAFSVPCQNRACARRIDWTLNLSELSVRALSDASREKFVQGNRFGIGLPGGHQGVFGLPVGKDEAQLARLQSGEDANLLPMLLNLRIRDIEGLPPLQRAAYLNRMSLRQARDLLAEFDRADCGVETDIDIECPNCGYGQRVSLPLEQGFLWPQNRSGSSQSAA